MAARRRVTILPTAGSAQQGLIAALQGRVQAWVVAGCPGASELSQDLLHAWFDEPHLLPDGRFFLWYAPQRRAVETSRPSRITSAPTTPRSLTCCANNAARSPV